MACIRLCPRQSMQYSTQNQGLNEWFEISEARFAKISKRKQESDFNDIILERTRPYS
jgi:hypothetical protein